MCRKTEPPKESPILTSARVARVVLAKWVTSDASPVSASVRDTRSRVGHTGDRSVEVHPALGAVGAIPDNGRTGQLWILLPTLDGRLDSHNGYNLRPATIWALAIDCFTNVRLDRWCASATQVGDP